MKSLKSQSFAGRDTQARQRTHRFADPWRFRSISRRAEGVASLYGHAIESRIVRRGGVLVAVVPHHLVDIDEDESERPEEQKSSMCVLRRRQSAAFSRYRRQAWCTAIELRTIEAMWFGGLGTRQLARLEGVSPAAISDRVAGLWSKAPEFARWYRLRRLLKVGHDSPLRDRNRAATSAQRADRSGEFPIASDIPSDIAPRKSENGRKPTPRAARIGRP